MQVADADVLNWQVLEERKDPFGDLPGSEPQSAKVQQERGDVPSDSDDERPETLRRTVRRDLRSDDISERRPDGR